MMQNSKHSSVLITNGPLECLLVIKTELCSLFCIIIILLNATCIRIYRLNHFYSVDIFIGINFLDIL